MSTKLYVGNISFQTTENDLQDAFAQHGAVREVQIIMDRATGRSRGFAFVTMEDDAGAEAAIRAMHNQELDGRKLTVNEARPPAPREGGFGGGGGGGYRGGGGGGGGGYRGGSGGGRREGGFRERRREGGGYRDY
jgi:RNA recognition motif-containing protein